MPAGWKSPTMKRSGMFQKEAWIMLAFVVLPILFGLIFAIVIPWLVEK